MAFQPSASNHYRSMNFKQQLDHIEPPSLHDKQEDNGARWAERAAPVPFNFANPLARQPGSYAQVQKPNPNPPNTFRYTDEWNPES